MTVDGMVDQVSRSIWATLALVIVLGIASVAAGRAFDLTWAGSGGLYFVVWWTVLFMILPIRIRTQSDLEDVTAGTEPGAPADPALRQRAIWTSIASAIVFVAVAALFPLAGL